MKILLSVQNLQGEEEGLVGLQHLSRNRKINGEKVISLTVMPNKANKHSYNMFEEESIVYFEDEPYVVKKLNEKSLGRSSIKRGDAIHKFYVDLINKHQDKIHNGSITFKRYMEEMVFAGTGIEVVLIDSFPARSFENLGNDNRLALLSKGVERFKAEFELVGNQARFRKQIGSKSDFQFRYGHNIRAINVDVDTTNLATVIRGKGDPELGIEAYHRSDNADIFGELDAPSVDDERFKSNEALLEEMKDRLQDVPEFSLQIDFADLRAAGYPYTVPNEGDSVFVIYEPMNGLEIETRILDIEEVFDKDLKVIKTVVTLANYKKTLAGSLFDTTQKQLKEIVDEDGVIKYNVLDEAVRIATEALHSAQTELIFKNGIIAREKDDPNRMTVYNSKGLGISKNGGQDFTEAITADGFVLSAGAIGRLKANNIQLGPETEFDDNYDPSSKETPEGAQDKADGAEGNAKDHANSKDSTLRENLRLTAALPTSISLNNHGITASTSDSNAYARLDYRGLYIRGGAIQIDGGLSDSQIASSGDWNTTKNTVDSNKDEWDKAGYFNNDGTLNSDKLKGKLSDAQLASAEKWNGQGTYINGDGVYTGVVVAAQIISGVLDTDKIKVQGDSGNNHLQIVGAELQASGLHERTWGGSTSTDSITIGFRDGQLRARNHDKSWSLFFNDYGISTFADGDGSNYPGGNASGAIEFHSYRYSGGAFRGLTIMSYGRTAIESSNPNGARIYLNPNGAHVHVADADDNYHGITASKFSQSSSEKQKRNIKDFEENALDIINSLRIREYLRKTSGKVTERDKWQVGIIVEESASQVLSDGDSVDIYSYVNILAKAVQELSQEVNQLKGVA